MKADPGNSEATLGMAGSLVALQQWEQAVKVLQGIGETAPRYVDARLMLCDLYLNRMKPQTVKMVEQAAAAIHSLEGRTEEARFFLARGDVFRVARKLARSGMLGRTTLAGLSDSYLWSIENAAEQSYTEYLRRSAHASNREEIVRRRLEVAPWRVW